MTTVTISVNEILWKNYSNHGHNNSNSAKQNLCYMGVEGEAGGTGILLQDQSPPILQTVLVNAATLPSIQLDT